jgi:hypothetical protein
VKVGHDPDDPGDNVDGHRSSAGARCDRGSGRAAAIVYDRSGSFAGSSITRGNSTSAYDCNGHFADSAIRNSNGIESYYDKAGRFVGSSVTTQPR